MIEHSSCKEKYREGSERAKFEMAEKLSVLSGEFQSSLKKNIKQNKKKKIFWNCCGFQWTPKAPFQFRKNPRKYDIQTSP